MVPRLFGVLLVWFAFAGCLHAEASGSADPIGGLIDDMLREEMKQSQPTNSSLTEALRTYDLDQAADEATRKITSGPQFFAYLQGQKESLSAEQFKALDPGSQVRILVNYAQTREKVKPEVKAWLAVSLPGVPWDQALAGYRQLEGLRPGDYLPKLLMVSRIQQPEFEKPTTQQWKDWLGILRQALPLAKTRQQVCDCLLIAGAGAMKLRPLENCREAPLEIWRWIRDVPLPENYPMVPDAVDYSEIKMWIAVAADDYTAAAELAGRSSRRALQPVFILLGGKKDEAVLSLERLRRDTTLTERERAGLRTMEPLVLIFAYKFEEARKIIEAQRKNPNLTAKETQWLQMMEEIRVNYEEGMRKRDKRAN